MFASKRCRGLVASWWATHARIHSCSTVSATSLRDSNPGADARGHVCATASAMNIPSDAASHDRDGAAGCGSGSGAPCIFQAGRRTPVEREVRARPLHTGEAAEWDEECVLDIVDAAVARHVGLELPD